MGKIGDLFGSGKANSTTTKLSDLDSQSSLLQQYWLALEVVDDCYQDLVQANADLLWYQGKIQEADNLVKGEKFERPSAIKLDRSMLPTELSGELMESALKGLCSELKALLDQRHERESSIRKLEKESSDKLQTLRSNLERLKNDLAKSTSRVAELNGRIDSLKTTRMGYIILLVCVGIGSALLTGNGIATVVITSIVLVGIFICD